ncbi:hypothetical protein VAR608DRAFT_6603 [Variovorax sp. HW608]|nr:hypothetical protein VAR608DRAFT_6603 [Variovorax sp. HW608]
MQWHWHTARVASKKGAIGFGSPNQIHTAEAAVAFVVVKGEATTSAKSRKSAKKKAASAAALLVEDEFNNLRWAHRAYDCVQNFLAPLNARSVEEFLIEPSELTALMEVINAEMGRRIQTVGEAIHAARKVLH